MLSKRIIQNGVFALCTKKIRYRACIYLHNLLHSLYRLYWLITEYFCDHTVTYFTLPLMIPVHCYLEFSMNHSHAFKKCVGFTRILLRSVLFYMFSQLKTSSHGVRLYGLALTSSHTERKIRPQLYRRFRSGARINVRANYNSFAVRICAKQKYLLQLSFFRGRYAYWKIILSRK